MWKLQGQYLGHIFPQNAGEKCGQVIDLDILTKKLKTTIFIVFWAQQGKKTTKQTKKKLLHMQP